MNLHIILKLFSEIHWLVSGPEQDFPPSAGLPSSHFLFWFRNTKPVAGEVSGYGMIYAKATAII